MIANVADITPAVDLLTGDAISGGNAFVANVKCFHLVNGTKTKDDAGPVRAFLASSARDNAPVAFETLEAVCAHTGNDGRWLITFSSQQMQAPLLSALFRTTPPFLIIETPHIRVFVPLQYQPQKAANLFPG